MLASLAEEWGMEDNSSFHTQLAPCVFTRSDKNRALTYLSPGVKEHCVEAVGADRLKCVWSG